MQYLVTSARSACLSDSLRKVETFMSRSSFSVGVVPGEIGTRRMKLFQVFPEVSGNVTGTTSD